MAKGGKAGKGGKGGKGGKAPPKRKSTAALVCKLPPSDVLTVVRAEAPPERTEANFLACAEAARKAVAEHLDTTGAVLLRGLPMRSADDFSQFWKAYLSLAPAIEEGKYSSLGPSGGRDKLAGVDLATNVPPEFL